MAWCKTTPWIKANLCHDMHVMCMRTPPRKFQSPDCGNFIDTNVFNQTFRIYTQTMMEKTFFDVRVFNPHAFSNRNQTPFTCYRKHKREKKRTYAQRILEVEHSSFTPLVFSATCRRNRERSNLFLQTSWLLYMLAQKWDHSYSTTLCCGLRCQLTFSPFAQPYNPYEEQDLLNIMLSTPQQQ